MSEAIYFHVTLEPHHKHSGKRTGRRISFLAEVPLDAAKAAAQSSDDEQLLVEEAKRLVAALLVTRYLLHRGITKEQIHLPQEVCGLAD